ncbi:uncharacterized protein [Panulirus ornatus]|uniref:uncharacterized protein isoform X2 n=1 Tax=Panulirus ornatus TaxID=150431 RepID=UPI003A8A3885
MAGLHHPDASCGAPPEYDAEKKEELRAGDLDDGPVHTELPGHSAQEEYYSSLKFAVGYQELQERWSRGWGSNRGGCCPQLTPASPQLHPSTRKRSFFLPLQEMSSSTSPSDVGGAGFSHGLRGGRWNSSTGSSPVGTPSPLPSVVSSPLVSSPCDSATSSPRQKRVCQGETSSYASSLKCVSSGSCCGGGDEVPALEEGAAAARNDRTGRGRLVGLLESLRQALHSLRRRPRRTPTTTLHDQVVVLEAELESYKQLSAAKRHAADLLKHQLMEALYEQVVSQLEQEQRHQQLQQEAMALEIQLHVLRAVARRDLRQLNAQLQREASDAASVELSIPPAQ